MTNARMIGATRPMAVLRAMAAMVLYTATAMDPLFCGAVGGGGNQNKIWVYDTATGQELGIITPGPEVGLFGWIDFTQGLRAVQRKDGETLLFVEDVYKEKQVMYRCRPER